MKTKTARRLRRPQSFLSVPRPRFGTTAGGLTFYESQLETGIWDGLFTQIDTFNEASGGAILLDDGGARKGRKPVETFMDTASGLIQSRDPSSGTATLVPTEFTDSEHRAIKLFRGAPMNLRGQDWADKGLDTQTGTRLFGEQYGKLLVLDYLKAVCSALVGAIGAITGATHDITGETTKTANFPSLNKAAFKMGDHRGSLRAILAHSAFFADLVGQAFASQIIAYQLGNTTIATGGVVSLNLQQVMSDVDALVNLNGSLTDTYNSLLLVAGAARVKAGPSRSQASPVTGTAIAAPANQIFRLSIESEFEISIKGVSYKSGSSDNPNNAALATSSNWELVGESVKAGPGIKLLHQ